MKSYIKSGGVNYILLKMKKTLRTPNVEMTFKELN
jgi:hypothetical protein